MAYSNELKREAKNIDRSNKELIGALRDYLETDYKNTQTKKINFTTSISVGGLDVPLETNNITVSAGGKIISNNQVMNNQLRHKHSISWDDIERAYKLQEAIHSMVADEYAKLDKGYRGRRLYQQLDNLKITNDAAGRKLIKGSGSQLTVGGDMGYGYGHHMINNGSGKLVKVGNYGKLDIDIQKRVLGRIYGSLYKETNKHLLDKFKTINLGGGSSADFKKLIKVTQELVFDIKKAKEWLKEVESIVNKAELKYKAEIKNIQKAQQLKQNYKPDYILSIRELELIGRAILGLSTELCPIETGFLRSSGKLYVSDVDIRIIYECPYAAYVHDNVNANHPVGQAKFLETAAQQVLPTISVWTENTGDDAFVLGDYMKQTWDRDSAGNITSDMYWLEHKGYQAVYIDIDRNLKVNYAHYK